MRKEILTTACLLVSTIAGASTEQVKVIYGTDNRTDAPLHSNKALKALTTSVAARIPKSDVVIRNDRYELPKRTLRAAMGVCTTERFSTQRTAAECTGFLIAPDVLVTAGHCMEDSFDCKSNYWAFDYLYTTRSLGESQVFECDSIIARELSSKNDFAIIQLNKVAEGRTPLKLRRSGTISASDGVAVIGHPSGLPLKITDGGTVRAPNPSLNYFVSTLDTYGGNSGSPVFNTSTLEVEGILVRGESDYKYDSSRRCYKSNICSMSSCRGEDVQKITALPLASLNL
ncbi:MAG: serine protease [Bdellovibrionota bacterium]